MNKSNNKIIKFPISKLPEQLYNSTIKYIFEFYEVIYPKLIVNDINNIYKFSNFSDKKENFKIINENEIFCESINYLVSAISMTNWLQEYNDFNPFGLLIKYDSNKHCSKGIFTSVINYPNICVSSISNNWISIYDYYQLIISSIENDEDSTFINSFNINNFIINDGYNGNTNVFLPIYINKDHWKLVKIIWTFHLSFINNSFQYNYNKKMDNIYYFVLLKSLII